MVTDRRMKAWETRRAKYGNAGHSGPYRTGPGFDISRRYVNDLGRRALALVLRMHEEGTLSEGQCCTALSLDRVSFRELADRARE